MDNEKNGLKFLIGNDDQEHEKRPEKLEKIKTINGNNLRSKKILPLPMIKIDQIL